MKDSFEWDLNNENLTPMAYARDLYSAIGIKSQELVKSLANSITDQLLQHIDSHTFFPR